MVGGKNIDPSDHSDLRKDIPGKPRHPRTPPGSPRDLHGPPWDNQGPPALESHVNQMGFNCFSKRPWRPPRHPRRVAGRFPELLEDPWGAPGTPRDFPGVAQGIAREAPGMPTEHQAHPRTPRDFQGPPRNPYRHPK